jgi:hypothetical protein
VLRIGLEAIWLPCSVVAPAHRALDPVDDYLPSRRIGPRRRPRLSRRSSDPIERFAAALREP